MVPPQHYAKELPVAKWLHSLRIGLALLILHAPVLAAPTQTPAPVADLVKAVDIPYQQFTLPNGLRVIVSTDRKAPVVAVSRSEEHTSELQSLMTISYAVFCLKKN